MWNYLGRAMKMTYSDLVSLYHRITVSPYHWHLVMIRLVYIAAFSFLTVQTWQYCTTYKRPTSQAGVLLIIRGPG